MPLDGSRDIRLSPSGRIGVCDLFLPSAFVGASSFSGATPSNHELSFDVAVVVSYLAVADPRILW